MVSETLKQKMVYIREKLALAKFHFDCGYAFMVFLNFSLLIVAASGKIQQLWNISAIKLWFILVPSAIFGTWLFGFFLDKVAKYQSSYYKTLFKRSPQISETLSIVKELTEKVDKIEKKLDARETDGRTRD